MRRANQQTAVYSEDGNALLSFGFDFCAEHEFGIRHLREQFGVSGDEADLTVQRLAVTQVPEGRLHLVEAEVETIDWSKSRRKRVRHARLFLLGGDEFPYRGTLAEFVIGYRDSYPQPDKPQAHWDDSAFLFSAPTASPEADVVRQVHAAMLAHDALLYTMAGGPFGGAGLVIVRRSTIPAALIEQMEEGFRDQAALKAAAEATGIRERVEAWGERAGTMFQRTYGPFYALSPRWRSEGDERQSAHPVIFWLNPTDQKNNESGWYTVEELDAWIAGDGPVPKAKAKAPA